MRSSYPRTSSDSNYQNGDCVTGCMAPGPSLAMKMWCQVISKLTPLLITAASQIGITKQRYQRVHSNTAIVLNFADFPKNASFKSYGVICLPRAAPAS